MRKTSGISLMLLIFLSLCLIVFSLLSLSGAVADEKLSQKAADRTTEYYRAETAANEILSRIDAQLAAYLKAAQEDPHPEAAYLSLCSGISQDIPEASWNRPEISQNEPDTSGKGSEISGAVAFIVPINDKQELQAELLIAYPENPEDTLYQVISWKTVNTGDWKADTSQNVFRPGTTNETGSKE